ncbi:MAG: OadG family protein [Lachnospiraceae bacterium]|nr:OadG family protein [Lachnospiraceae bacterium]
MKKRLSILGLLLISILALTACGKDTTSPEAQREAEKAAQYEATGIEYATGILQQLSMLQGEGSLESYLGESDDLDSMINNYISGMADVGNISEMGEATAEVNKDTVVVNIPIIGTQNDPEGNARTANVEMVINMKDTNGAPDLAVNPKYTTSELMTKAGLNTLLGMGVTFSILILISLIISCFTIIGKIQNRASKKQEENIAAVSVDNAVRQIVETEESSDDDELIAVISAAIAAYESETGAVVAADGVVIRSVRKINKRKWQNA